MTRPTALDAIGAAAAEALERITPTEEQLELLPTRHLEGTDEHQRLVARVGRARGRPEGSRNIATAQTVDFVRRVFGDPLIESARWLLHTPETLAAELGCNKTEAFDRLEAIRRDLRRYCHAPLAPVDGQGNAVPPALAVLIGGSPGLVAADGTLIPPWERASHEIKEIQALSDPVEAPSHTEPSHESKNDDGSAP